MHLDFFKIHLSFSLSLCASSLFAQSDTPQYSLFVLPIAPILIAIVFIFFISLWNKNKQLQTSQNLFEELSRHTRAMHWEVDTKGLYTYVSPNVKSLLGYDVEEIVNKLYFYELRPLEDREMLIKRVFTTFASHQPYDSVEGRILTKEGEMLWISTYAFPLFFKDGTLKGYRGSNTDISKEKIALDALKESKLLFKTLHNASFGGILLHNDGIILECNQGLSRLFGYAHEEFIGMSGLQLISPKERAAVLEKMFDEEEEPYETLGLHHNGTSFHVRLECKKIPYKGKMVRVVEFRDIQEEKKAKEKLALASSVFTSAREGIVITDTNATIIDVNESFCRITGFSKEEIIGKTPKILNSGHHDISFYQTMWDSLVTKGHWYGEIWNRRKNGEIYPEMLTITVLQSKENIPTHYIGLFSDISALKEHQKQLEHIAQHDALTGLPNRLLLADRLKQGILQSKRRGDKLMIIYLDLDGFKHINDLYGHDIGDSLLIALSLQIKHTLREGDTLARLGGDEFVMVLQNITTLEASLAMLNRILEATAKPITLASGMLSVSASLGVTFYSYESNDIEADGLLRQADQAMYQAKLLGKNRYHIFDSIHDANLRSHHESLEQIRLALYRNEFVLYYQPKVNLRTGEFKGVEALIRWNHPQKGLLSPSSFLPIIEEHPLNVDIGEWVIKEALRQMQTWMEMGQTIAISVNVSARQLKEIEFATRLGAFLEMYPLIDSSLLELEILETSAIEDLNHISSLIAQCNAKGVSFALDDFGTGYSSLSYLKQLPVKILKIDQSFVRDMLDDVNDLAILKGVIGLAEAFHKEVIAEGVERIEQGKVLLSLGCDLAQGYGIAHPMPAENLPSWIDSWMANKQWLLYSDDEKKSEEEV